MTDAEFYKSFHFNLYCTRQYRTTDLTAAPGCGEHYLARMVSGKAKIVTRTQTLQLETGDVFYIPKGLQYRSHWYPENDPATFYSFGFTYFPADDASGCTLQKINCTPAATQLLGELESDLTVSPLSIGRLYRFLGEARPVMETAAADAGSLLVRRALEYMRQQPLCSVSETAQHCGVSESTLYARFRRHLGKTPVEARHRILADKAGELLITSDLSVEEISDRLGFSSPSWFRKVFREQNGCTPTFYRKNAGGI